MAMSRPMSDYDTDVYAWSQRQGALLRRLAAGERVNDADLDWPNIAEEIETVGRSERAAVASHIRNLMEHLAKLQASPATEPRPGWRAAIRRTRIEIESLLEDSPSLKREVGKIVVQEMPRARRLASAALEEHGETPLVDLQTLAFSEDQVLGDWLPDGSQ
jgi:Domain of unknown function DUF29